MSRIETLDASMVQSFTLSETAVLILAKAGCESCARWTAELEAELADASAFPGARFGVLYLDRCDLVELKRATPWLADVTHLPHNVVYRCGERVKSFAGGGVDRLRSRLERIG